MNEEAGPKQKCHSVVDVSGGESQGRCCKEQYLHRNLECQVHESRQIGSAISKQEMARVNVDILGIRELKWTGMGKFNSDDHYIYYCGQESLRRNGVAIMVNKRVLDAVLVYYELAELTY